MQTKPMTTKQAKTLRIILDHTREHGHSPTYEKLGELSGVSKVTVYGHVNELIKKGYLKREPNAGNGLTPLTTPPDELPQAAAQAARAMQAALAERFGGDDPCIDKDATTVALRAAIARLEGLGIRGSTPAPVACDVENPCTSGR